MAPAQEVGAGPQRAPTPGEGREGRAAGVLPDGGSVALLGVPGARRLGGRRTRPSRRKRYKFLRKC